MKAILIIFAFFGACLFSGCDKPSADIEYAELCFTRSAEMQRFYVWRYGENQQEVFRSQNELAEYLNLDQSGDGEVLFPLVSALIEDGWSLVGVSSRSSQTTERGESVTVLDPLTVTYHFTRNR